MVDLILKAMIPAILDKLKEAGPDTIRAVLAWLSKGVPSSIDAVTAGFRKTYADVTARVATWAAKPETATKFVGRFEQALAWVKDKLDKKK